VRRGSSRHVHLDDGAGWQQRRRRAASPRLRLPHAGTGASCMPVLRLTAEVWQRRHCQCCFKQFVCCTVAYHLWWLLALYIQLIWCLSCSPFSLSSFLISDGLAAPLA
jgi:hypothetical protein